MEHGFDKGPGRELLEVCRSVGQSSLASAYYLAGGTGLALQMGHRRSVDLDWFRRSSHERVPAQSIARELERLFGPENVRPVRRQVDQATWAIRGSDLADIDATLRLVYEPVTPRQVEAFLRERVAEFVRRRAEEACRP